MATSGEGSTVFTPPFLSAMAPALGEEKGLIKYCEIKSNLFNELDYERYWHIKDIIK